MHELVDSQIDQLAVKFQMTIKAQLDVCIEHPDERDCVP